MTDTDLIQIVASEIKDRLRFFVPSDMQTEGNQVNFTTTLMDSSFSAHYVEVYIQIRESGMVAVTLYNGLRQQIKHKIRYGMTIPQPARWPMSVMAEERPLADPDCIDRLAEFCQKWIKILGR